MSNLNYKKIGAYNMIEIKTCDHHEHAYKPHLHSALSVGIVQKGSTVLNVNGIDYKVTEGDGIVIYPYVTHNCKPVDIDNWAFTMLYIEEAFYQTNDLLVQLRDKIGIKKLSDQEIKLIFGVIDLLKTSKDPFAEEVGIIDVVNEIFVDQALEVELGSDGIESRVRDYLNDHYLEELTLKNLETHFKINRYTLIRKFKAKYNTTPSAYQLQLKINYSKHLLGRGLNLLDVAFEAGFFDQAHFSREFKKVYGITPLQYFKSINS